MLMKNSKTICPHCGGKMQLNKAFCNLNCKDAYFEEMKIILSPKFVRATFRAYRDSKNKLEEALSNFARYHKFNPELVVKKFYKTALVDGYKFSWVIQKSGNLN